MFMTFYGPEKGDHHAHEHAHESPWTMLVPLGVLSLGAVFSGMIWFGSFFGEHEKVNAFFGIPHHAAAAADDHAAEATAAEGEDHAAAATSAEGEDHAAEATSAEGEDHAAEATNAEGADHAAGPVPGQGAIFMAADNHVMDDAHHAPKWVKVAPFVAMLIGFLVAFQMYIRRPDLPGKLAANQRPLYLFLLNKWYFDEIYDAVFVRPAVALGRLLWRRGDGDVIDGGINGVAMGIIPFITRLAGRAQSGYVFHYAFAMVLGIAILLTWVSLTGGAN
jgi:NADH-quinone oxidoreductase subunit L